MVIRTKKDRLDKNDTDIIQVNPKHHPIVVLEADDKEKVLKRVACHDGTSLTSNVFRKSTKAWAIKKTLAKPKLIER